MSLFRSRIPLLGAVIAVLLVATACGGDKEVAAVGDDTLTQDEVVDLLFDPEADAASAGDETLTDAGVADLVSDDLDGTIGKQAAADAIATWIRNQIWYAELDARDYAVTDEQLAETRAQLEEIALADPSVPDLTTPMGAEIVRGQALPVIVADYLLNELQVEPVWPEQMCSSHVLVDTEEAALAVIARIDAGEDFAALAGELSIDTGTPDGDLGCVDPASFVAEFVEGARLVDAPGISAPVQSEFGWHVISVRSFDRSPSDDPVVIQNAAFATEEFQAMQDDVLAREVTIDPRYGTWDVATFSVIPATG